jgi:hypothetical protein
MLQIVVSRPWNRRQHGADRTIQSGGHLRANGLMADHPTACDATLKSRTDRRLSSVCRFGRSTRRHINTWLILAVGTGIGMALGAPVGVVAATGEPILLAILGAFGALSCTAAFALPVRRPTCT